MRPDKQDRPLVVRIQVRCRQDFILTGHDGRCLFFRDCRWHGIPGLLLRQVMADGNAIFQKLTVISQYLLDIGCRFTAREPGQSG